MNVVCLTGRVGRDAEVHTFESGGCIISFSMATNERYKNKQEQWVDKTTWHECKKSAQSDGIAQYIVKGDNISVVGSVTLEEWGEGENKKSRTVIKLKDITLLGGKKDSGHGPKDGAGDFGSDDIPNF